MNLPLSKENKAACGLSRSNPELRGGISLIELLFALMILVIGMLSTLLIFSRISLESVQSSNAVAAINLCEERLEEIKDCPYAQIIQANFPSDRVRVGVLPGTRSVTIQGVWMPDGNLGPPDDSESYKKITVRVEWIEGQPRQRSLFTYVCRR